MSCCRPLIERVISVTPATDPVVITVNKPLAEVAQENCFRLLFQPCSLESINTNPVSISDGTNTYVMIQGCTGNVVRYDQLVEYVHRHSRKDCGCFREVILDCFFGNDGMPESVVHVVVNTRLCRSSFVVTPTVTIE